MFDRNTLKRTGRYNVRVNFPEILIIQLINYFLPMIFGFLAFGYAGFAISSNNPLLIQDNLEFVMSTYPLRYSIFKTIFSVIIPFFITYWATNYYMHIHVNKGYKVSPFEVLRKLNLINFLRYIAKIIVTNFFVTLWSLLLIIPGLIKAYSYYLVPFIAIDQPELGIFETIEESQRLMNGNKMGAFVLNCSFILWSMAVGFSFGLLSFYVYPYIALTDIALYFELKYPTYQNNFGYDKVDLNIYKAQANPDDIEEEE